MFLKEIHFAPRSIADVTRTRNGERGKRNGERGTGNGERGTGSGEWGVENGKIKKWEQRREL